MYLLAMGVLLAWDCQGHDHKPELKLNDVWSNCSEPTWIAKFLLCKIKGIKSATICDTLINNKQQAKAKISASHFKIS